MKHAVKLRVLAQAVRDALIAQDNAIRAVKSAEAEEDIAKAAPGRQYEVSYLNARKDPGRSLAERLFPASRGISAAPEPAPAPTPG